MYRGAMHRRPTGAQALSLDMAPAPCRPALRFSGIFGQLLSIRIPKPPFDLKFVSPAHPAIYVRRVPKNGIYCRRFGLIIGIDLTHLGLDLESFKRPGA